MRYLFMGLAIVGLVAFRMLFANPAWFLLPKKWQHWLYDGPTPRYRIR
jgi:hypothetical protein